MIDVDHKSNPIEPSIRQQTKNKKKEKEEKGNDPRPRTWWSAAASLAIASAQLSHTPLFNLHSSSGFPAIL